MNTINSEIDYLMFEGRCCFLPPAYVAPEPRLNLSPNLRPISNVYFVYHIRFLITFYNHFNNDVRFIEDKLNFWEINWVNIVGETWHENN